MRDLHCGDARSAVKTAMQPTFRAASCAQRRNVRSYAGRRIHVLARRRERSLGIVALAALGGSARADGERSPMFGVTLSAAETGQQAPMVGGGLDVAWWYGRVGIAGEGAVRWDSQRGEDRAT